MTEKQENILNAAIELFAENGFNATSTNKIAKAAGVSEGLIFKHFTNKDGLRDAIIEMAMDKISQPFMEMTQIEDPHERLDALFAMITGIDESDFNFWRFVMALKWQQQGEYDDSKSEPMIAFVEKIFIDLSYDEPRLEAEALLTALEGIWTAVLLRKGRNIERISKTLRKKYS